MTKRANALVLLTMFALLSIGLPAALIAADTDAIPQRADIEDKYKWNVEDLYATEEAWEADFALLEASVSEFDKYKGHLGDSPQMLMDYFNLSDSLGVIEGNLYVYAYLKQDEDNRESKYQELTGRISALYSFLSEAESFIEPELIALGSTKIESFMKEMPELQKYQHYFEDMFRQQEHVLSAEEEAILAATGPLGRAPNRIFRMIDAADHKLGTIVDSSGKKIELTRGRYYRLMETGDRYMRRQANDTVQNSWLDYVNTLTATLGASVEKDWFYSKVRGYETCLESSLDGDNIPTSVVHNLVDAVNANLASLHKWTALKKKVLGYDTLHTFDQSVPLVPEYEREYTYQEAMDMNLNGLKPLGEDYLKDFKMGLESGWVDVYENEGKGSGAYSWGTYTSHPYVLLNFNGTLENVFTLAHEMGHALNSYYSNQTEPYVYAGHSLFTAEVASTCNEAILMKYMLAHTKSKEEKIALLNYYIRQISGTFFTQVMFCEFELAIHDRIEKGDAFSVDWFRQTYRDIYQKYYGPELYIGPNNDMGCLKIGHFYRMYYVYQYATSYSAAQMLSQRILEGDKEALDAYMKFLATGTSMYPVDILKFAGVDLTSPEPVQRTMTLFGELVDEMEALLLEE